MSGAVPMIRKGHPRLAGTEYVTVDGDYRVTWRVRPDRVTADRIAMVAVAPPAAPVSPSEGRPPAAAPPSPLDPAKLLAPVATGALGALGKALGAGNPAADLGSAASGLFGVGGSAPAESDALDAGGDPAMGSAASQAGEGAGKGAAIAGSVTAPLEAVPVFGTAIHAIATALGAIIGAICGGARDTFNIDQPSAAAWLTLFRIAPGLLFEGVDKTGGDPKQASRLVNYMRNASGEVPVGFLKNTPVVFNPSDANRDNCSENPFLCPDVIPDPSDPLNNVATLTRILNAHAKNYGAIAIEHPSIKTPADAAAYLDLIRANPAPFAGLMAWDDVFGYHPGNTTGGTDNKAYLRRELEHAMKVAGETGNDPILSNLFGGPVTVPGPRKPPNPDLATLGMTPAARVTAGLAGKIVHAGPIAMLISPSGLLVQPPPPAAKPTKPVPTDPHMKGALDAPTGWTTAEKVVAIITGAGAVASLALYLKNRKHRS
jgi:hypothetical protein